MVLYITMIFTVIALIYSSINIIIASPEARLGWIATMFMSITALFGQIASIVRS